MRPLDIALAVATLEWSPDPTKADVLREEVRSALLRQEISAQTYAETLRLQVLKDDLAPIVASRREAADFFELALVSSRQTVAFFARIAASWP